MSLRGAPQELLDYFEHVFAQQQKWTAELIRVTDLLHGGAKPSEQEFIGDELSLLMNVHPGTAQTLVAKAVLACGVPGLVAAMEAGELTDRHVHAATHELYGCLSSPDARETVLATVLTRCRSKVSAGRRWPYPGELARMLRAEALRFDQQAAERRKEQTRRDRGVVISSLPDGAASLGITGPAEQVVVMHEALRARAAQRSPGDERSSDQRMFDAACALLTGAEEGGPLPGLHVQVLVPISTALGADVELAELVGYGPILPSTARDLLEQAETVQRVCVDARTGQVRGVDDAEVNDLEPVDWMLTVDRSAPIGRSEGPGAYRPTPRVIRFVKTRDQTCRFPGCARIAYVCDVDHRREWPLGPTDPRNLQCLCRHHHRAKQSSLFTVAAEPDGTTVWTTRSGRVYERPPPAW